MPPPKLSRNAPISNVFHPIEVRFRPVLRNKTRLTILYGCDGRIGAGKGKIIHLAEEEDTLAIDSGLVDVAFMGGGLEIESRIVKNCINMLFPTNTRLGVALEGTLDREDEAAVQTDLEGGKIPIRIGIIDADKSRDRGRRRMGISILSVATKSGKVECSGKCEEEALGGLFHARGVSFSEGVEAGRGTGGAITTIT